MRLRILLLFIVSSTHLLAQASCGASLKEGNVARRIVQVGGVALGLWVGGAFLHEEDPEEFDPGYDYERIEAIRKKREREVPKDYLVEESTTEKIN